ncbi:unnamed protein product [Caenorhabditis brenneri]
MSETFSKRCTTDPEYIELFNYLINKTNDAKSPINIQQLIRDFKRISGAELTDCCCRSRIDKIRKDIHSFEHIETDIKVRMLFVLSVPVNGDFLKKLSNDALVEVDGNNRITHYKSESLELKGYHGLSMRGNTKNYWIYDREGIDLLNFLIEKTTNVKPPMNSAQLARDFKRISGAALTDGCLKSRIEKIRKDIQSFDHIDMNTKVRMLFALSVPVNRDFLKKISNDAHVEVDEGNRITHYKSERLELKGYHRQSTAYDIDLLNYLIEETKNVKPPMNLAHLARDFKEKTGALQTAESLEQRIERLRTNIQNFWHIDEKVKVKLLFALSAPVNAHFLRKLKERAFVKVDNMNRITYYKAINDGMGLRGDHSVLAKLSTAHFDSELSHRAPTFETPISSKRKAGIWVSSSSKRTLLSPNHGSLELQGDHDTNYSIDDQVKLEPFRESIQEDFNEIVDNKDIQQIPKPIETPIKIEVEEPIEVKPETSHNSKIKFFEAMQSLILCLDTPCLSQIKSEIHQKIQKVRKLDEVILNNEISLIIDSMISRMINDSVVNLPETAESVNLSNFLCYLKASILNSKLNGVEGFLRNISKLIEESPDKRTPMEEVANAFRATLDDVDF